jgi:hypothetical protein
MGSDSGFSKDRPAPSHTVSLHAWKGWGHSEPAPTSAPWRMDGKWSGNSFLLGSSSLANHGGYLSCFLFFYLPANNPQCEVVKSAITFV